MTSYFNLQRKVQEELLTFGEEKLSKRPNLLEKDIWLCWVLDVLFNIPNKKPMAFKGGTSLSRWTVRPRPLGRGYKVQKIKNIFNILVDKHKALSYYICRVRLVERSITLESGTDFKSNEKPFQII